MREIQITWQSRSEYERVSEVRERHGLHWRGMLLEGGKHAESYDLLNALFDLNPELVTGDSEEFSRLQATTTLADAAARHRERLYREWDAQENEAVHPTSPHANKYEALLGNSAEPVDDRARTGPQVGTPWETADTEGEL